MTNLSEVGMSRYANVMHPESVKYGLAIALDPNTQSIVIPVGESTFSYGQPALQKIRNATGAEKTHVLVDCLGSQILHQVLFKHIKVPKIDLYNTALGSILQT